MPKWFNKYAENTVIVTDVTFSTSGFYFEHNLGEKPTYIMLINNTRDNVLKKILWMDYASDGTGQTIFAHRGEGNPAAYSPSIFYADEEKIYFQPTNNNYRLYAGDEWYIFAAK